MVHKQQIQQLVEAMENCQDSDKYTTVVTDETMPQLLGENPVIPTGTWSYDSNRQNMRFNNTDMRFNGPQTCDSRKNLRKHHMAMKFKVSQFLSFCKHFMKTVLVSTQIFLAGPANPPYDVTKPPEPYKQGVGEHGVKPNPEESAQYQDFPDNVAWRMGLDNKRERLDVENYLFLNGRWTYELES